MALSFVHHSLLLLHLRPLCVTVHTYSHPDNIVAH